MIIISKYSGRFDVFDELVLIQGYTEEELKNNVKIYISNNSTPLKIESYKDVIPYYPYTIAILCCDNKERESTMYISSESFVDRDEREILEIYLKQILEIYNSCKTKEIEFDVEKAVEKVCFQDYDKCEIRKLANRVKENGNKTNINDIHLAMHERHRKILVNEMLINNMNPVDYGDYKRFVEKQEDKNGSIKR